MHEGQIDLLPGERVIWAGQPVRRPLFNPGDLFNVPFGLLWLAGVTVFFFYNHDTLFHTVAWVVLTVAGVFHLAGRPLIRYLRLGSTTYAVTDGRVIATSSFFGRREQTAELAEQDDPVVTQGPAKTGTITFGKLGVLAWASANYGAATGKDRKPSVVLVGVSDVNKVRDRLAKAVAEARLRKPRPPEPPKAESPETKPSKTEPSKTELPEVKDPEAEAPEPKGSETEASKAEQPTTELPKVKDPEAEAPKPEAPKPEAPKPEAPKTAAPQAEQPTTELPKVKDPAPTTEEHTP